MSSNVTAVDVISEDNHTIFNHYVAVTGDRYPSLLSYYYNVGNDVVPELEAAGYSNVMRRDVINKKGEDRYLWWFFNKDKTVIAQVGFNEHVSCVIVYRTDCRAEVDELVDILNRYKHVEPEDNDAHIYLIQANSGNFYTNKFTIRDPKVDVDKHYNADFKAVHERIVEELNKDDNHGIVILHGLPGTGKTNYIRYLTKVLKKKVMFLPTHMTEMLTSPSFLPFLSKQENSILLIEEAEKVLMSRDQARGNEAVSNILNITDGILGDCVKLQVIATFNTGKENIDKALLRDGRLIANYEFDLLAADRASVLLAEQGDETGTTEPMTLSQIYNRGKSITVEKQKQQMGFGGRR